MEKMKVIRIWKCYNAKRENEENSRNKGDMKWLNELKDM